MTWVQMKILEKKPYLGCDFGDKRLTQRAVSIAECLSVKYGEPLSKVFESASELKRSYEFFFLPKTTFSKLTQPSFKQTARHINGIPVVLAVGDTSFLDYKKILDKRDDYGPTGNGGNGLILHTSLALDPDFGQPLGLLWEKLWHREKSQKPPISEEPELQKQRLKEKRIAQRKKAFEEKESYRWVEAFEKVENLFSSLETPIGGQTSRVIHVFDREGDIAEVFARVRQTQNTGVVVRAAQNRCIEVENSYLWSHISSQSVQFVKEIELIETKKRSKRTATLEVRFCPVSISPPSRLKNSVRFNVYAVYAKEIDIEQEIQSIIASGQVAPGGCWIVRYLAKGRHHTYWYYKLQATKPIFLTKTDGKGSRYQHLGKAGSQAYLDALEQITRRAKIEALDRAVEILNQGLKDLVEETSKHKNS